MNSNLLALIGNTPLVEIRHLNPNPNVRILAKIECQNPGGSIKDRVAAAMIAAAEESGELTRDKIIIEATSGNTGVGLAMVAAIKGYRIKLLMPETASEERKMIMAAFGAELELTPGHLATDGAIEQAYRYAREEPEKYVLMDQYNNLASIDAHYNGTGLEIWNQTNGQVTHCVMTLGTSGTAMGIAKRLHEMGAVHVAAVEPYAGHKIQGLKNMLESYPPGIYDKHSLDEILHVEDEVAFENCRRLAREEGIFAGMSSGAALGGAIQLAERLDKGLIVTIFPDSGERYLSTHLYRQQAGSGVTIFDMASGADKMLNTGNGLGVYTMGPSLDNPDGLDSWRRLVLLDVFARHMTGRGVKVESAAGLTDMDDRTLAAARELSVSREAFVAERHAAVIARAHDMGLSESLHFPLSSASNGMALDLCRKLMGKGLAYEKLRSVYFDVFRDKRYGEIGTVDMDKVSGGRTVDLNAYVKDNPLDFTLLKRGTLLDLKRGEVLETQWGNVRPSWFLQHAATALTELPRTDVMIGSDKHRFPHLENLRAIWSTTGRELQAWIVSQQTSDCENENLSTVAEKLGGYRAARFWLLSVASRKPLCASAESLSMWARNWRKVQECAVVLTLALDARGDTIPTDVEQAVFDLKAGFKSAMDDALKLHQLWPALFRFIKQVNGWAADNALSGASAKACLDQLLSIDTILGILDPAQMPVPLSDLPDEVQGMVADRQKAREVKDFAQSDALRDRIAAAGFRVEDTAGVPRVFRV
ncbi:MULTISPECIES: cysteine synthase [unclassified Pseudodesulfovibrio]|uniref:cysteine synthase n=1 Tax=unclassified Pseudodesulfovibrio TaxID=2661612 RepID=UPI000FEBFE9B|nr:MULTISPECIES: cysteine synthase [unclassified Pseudodesulfovibrio]MCJ2165835.1 cysteine synthase [Pseudodesulfovibrio sp. S3-i]RWU02736.1 cysteine synthase [Pseudodesulfovibrio sp. S3]